MLCGCGCGQETKTYDRTRGDKKRGESQPFIRGHWNVGNIRTDIAPPNPSGICQCGCGRPVPIATMTNAKIGHVQGEHVRFIRGHVGYLKARSKITEDLWHAEDRGYATSCWIWNGPPWSRAGYCRVILNGKTRLAHRAMYEQEVGPIPRGLTIDHLCRQTSCVNPSHLEPVTRKINSRRSSLAKLTEEDAARIRESSESHTVVAARYGVSASLVSMIRSGKRWA